jgi:hypothetical protein
MVQHLAVTIAQAILVTGGVTALAVVRLDYYNTSANTIQALVSTTVQLDHSRM